MMCLVTSVTVLVMVTGVRAQDDAGADLDLDSMAGPAPGDLSNAPGSQLEVEKSLWEQTLIDGCSAVFCHSRSLLYGWHRLYAHDPCGGVTGQAVGCCWEDDGLHPPRG